MHDLVETDRLILKTLGGEYSDKVLEFYLNNKLLFEKYEAERPVNFYTITYFRSLLEYEIACAKKKSALRYWVFEKENPDLIIGTVSFQNFQRRDGSCCQVGYKFDAKYHGMRYAREALNMGSNVVFSEFNVTRIEAFIMPDNIASKKMIVHCGYQYEGTLRKKFKINGKLEDHEVYSKLRNE
ncbi:ribosomal-protein-alanine N-acetyltransferase [Acetitomaculum ruminis DSM 5522]|uniref:Ribosomal-protein-alanine N-acetyltransferase n=1 Tax=Acetitomaculum ruminis DSM 5522 TaxID=1120918 RepID=A0A1I0Y9B2_9FIRM|nr:GNAT family protein [Acetitomaculum ruminis]SFB09939.1 ribosomal-protein-alanine N-acetyltransferase [Acetitomaculum ruminis DSM 5522]